LRAPWEKPDVRLRQPPGRSGRAGRSAISGAWPTARHICWPPGCRLRAAGRPGAIRTASGAELGGEILGWAATGAEILPEGAVEGVAVGDKVEHLGQSLIAPRCQLDRPRDRSLRRAARRPAARPRQQPRALRAPPPMPARRKRLGGRLATGLDAFNTSCRWCAASGSGFSRVRASARRRFWASSPAGSRPMWSCWRWSASAGASCAISSTRCWGRRVGAVGRRHRDLGPLAAGAPPRALTAMAVAEHFRDEGLHVLLLCDSITRFAEAHREIALAAGEARACAASRPRPRIRSCRWPNAPARAGRSGRHHRHLHRARRRVGHGGAGGRHPARRARRACGAGPRHRRTRALPGGGPVALGLAQPAGAATPGRERPYRRGAAPDRGLRARRDDGAGRALRAGLGPADRPGDPVWPKLDAFLGGTEAAKSPTASPACASVLEQ
jgi:hypothetical protein